jgi:hypothetical protein
MTTTEDLARLVYDLDFATIPVPVHEYAKSPTACDHFPLAGKVGMGRSLRGIEKTDRHGS